MSRRSKPTVVSGRAWALIRRVHVVRSRIDRDGIPIQLTELRRRREALGMLRHKGDVANLRLTVALWARELRRPS